MVSRRVGQLALHRQLKDFEEVVVRSGNADRRTGRFAEKIDHLMNRLDGAVKIRPRLSADVIGRSCRRSKTYSRQLLEIFACAHHLARRCPAPVRDKNHEFPAGRNYCDSFPQRKLRQVNRRFPRIKQHRKLAGVAENGLNPCVAGKVNALHEQRIGHAKMRHSPRAQSMFGFSQVGKDHKTRVRLKRFKSRAITARSGPAAHGTRWTHSSLESIRGRLIFFTTSHDCNSFRSG